MNSANIVFVTLSNVCSTWRGGQNEKRGLSYHMDFLRHIIGLLAAFLFSVLGAVAMPMASTVSHQAEFFPIHAATVVEHTNVHFSARAPPTTLANVAVTGGVTVKHGSAFVTHGIEKQWTSLNFGADLYATNNALPNVPGRVQSRVNLRNGDASSGWVHTVNRHFGGNNTQSQFTLSQTEVRGVLQSDRVVSAPVTDVLMVNGAPTYVRRVDVGQPIGTVRQSHGGGSTSNLYVRTDGAGNLITAYPIP